MSKVHIVTDSTAHFEDPTAPQKLGVTVVPLTIQFGRQYFKEGIDLTPDEFFSRMATSAHPPTLHAPTADDFRAIYGRTLKSTDVILSLHISSKLSQTCARAKTAAEDYLGRCQIVVLDSWTTSVGLGILVEAAAQAANEGKSLGDIVRIVRGMVPHIYAVFFVDTLDYLEHSGLIGKSQSLLGTMLDIKPFLSIEEGEIIPVEKVRTRDRAIDKLTEFASEFSSIARGVILQSGQATSDDTRLLLEQLEMACPGLRFPVMRYGPALACQLGPDSLGIFIYEGLTGGEPAPQ
jgi:fatty acid kinase fatty acid binding subunit